MVAMSAKVVRALLDEPETQKKWHDCWPRDWKLWTEHVTTRCWAIPTKMQRLFLFTKAARTQRTHASQRRHVAVNS